MLKRPIVLAALALLACARPVGADPQCFARVPAGAAGAGVYCINIVPLPYASASEPVPGCATDFDLAQRGPDGECRLLELPRCPEDACAHGESGGSAVLECQIANGTPCDVGYLSLRILEGSHSSALREGIGERFDRDADRREGICYEEYRRGGGNGRRVVVVPLTSPPGPGRGWVQLRGFGAFFLKDRPGNGSRVTVRAQFLYRVVLGSATP